MKVVFDKESKKYKSEPLDKDSIQALNFIRHNYEYANLLLNMIDDNCCLDAQEHEVWELMFVVRESGIPCLAANSKASQLIAQLDMEIV